jgi:acetyl-CoA acetyltransferase
MSLVPTVGWKTVPNYNVAKEWPEYFIGMGHTSEKIAVQYKVNREESDEFSFQSHQKALNAIKNGLFKDEIVPVKVEEVYFADGKKQSRTFTVDTDEGPR